jgi:ATP-dependent Clp protease ATP-binding subunit ClpA
MTPPPSLQDLIDTVYQDSASEDLLDLLVTASGTVSQLEAVNDALIGHFVDRCRRDGRTWSQISAALGVSKQAVHKRFSVPIADRLISQTSPTLERFTARARSALAAADTAARELHQEQAGAEHLLLGLFAEPEGLAAKVLTAMDITRARVMAALPPPASGASAADQAEDAAAAAGAEGTEGAAGAGAAAGAAGAAASGSASGAGGQPTGSQQAGSQQAARPGEARRLPYTAEAVAALRDAVAEALEFGHNYIGTEHILLGLLRDPDAPVAKLLERLGADASESRVRISELLRGFTSGTAPAR